MAIQSATQYVDSCIRAKITELYIRCVSGETHYIPIRPYPIYTQVEIDRMGTDRQRIFYSYFAPEGIRLNVSLDWAKRALLTEFDYLLIGIYHMKKGMDENLTELIELMPQLLVFTIQDCFDALFRPDRDNGIPLHIDQSVEIDPEHTGYPFMIKLDGEEHHCLDLVRKLHNSPLLLHRVTYHIGEHSHVFRREIQRRLTGSDHSE